MAIAPSLFPDRRSAAIRPPWSAGTNPHLDRAGLVPDTDSVAIEGVRWLLSQDERRPRSSGHPAGTPAFAQKEASGSRPATGLRWPRGAPRRDKRRLPLSRQKQRPCSSARRHISPRSLFFFVRPSRCDCIGERLSENCHTRTTLCDCTTRAWGSGGQRPAYRCSRAARGRSRTVQATPLCAAHTAQSFSDSLATLRSSQTSYADFDSMSPLSPMSRRLF